MYIYKNKDGRVRAVIVKDNGKTTTKSYPRILMEESLGRPLEPYEDVHHKDENPSNNSIENLEIINHGKHQQLHSKKYYDKQATCEVCGKQFIWTGKRQSCYYRDIKRGKIELYHVLKNVVLIMVDKSSLGGILRLNAD